MKPITDILREYRNGRAVDQLTRQFNDCVRAVDATGKPAELTIKIKIEPDKGGGSGKELSIKPAAKIPQHDIPKAQFFSDSNGDLHRQDPAQGQMFRDTDDDRTAGRA